MEVLKKPRGVAANFVPVNRSPNNAHGHAYNLTYISISRRLYEDAHVFSWGTNLPSMRTSIVNLMN